MYLKLPKKRVGVKELKGELPEGCRLCAKGAKMVLFVTGVCENKCFYCPISKKRRGDVSFANERPVENEKAILAEAERMDAKGAGVTGGNPLARLQRTCEQIKLLKDAFGQGFHVHIYLPSANGAQLAALDKAGVDEVRFHWGDPQQAMEFDWDVGGEVPVVPGWEKRTVEFLKLLEKRGAKFCNLNELDFSETNAAELGRQGLSANAGTYAAMGSEELAAKIMEMNTGLSLHYCSSAFKDAVQLRQRYLRTARNVARPYEKVTSDGTIISGVINKRVGIPEPHHFVGRTTHCSPEVVKKYAKKWPSSVVEWVPTFDKEVREVTPL